MSATGSPGYAPRPTFPPLVWALAISLGVHLLFYGGFELGQHFKWWQDERMPDWLKKISKTLAATKPPQKAPPPENQPDPPLLFVEVDPSTATPEPPKDAKYYSSRNSKAANPEAQIETDTPNISGTQTHVPKTETAPRTKALPFQPAAPKPANQEEEAAEAKPKGGPKVGDLDMAKPDTKPGDGQADGKTGDSPTETHKRPRTLADAHKLNSALAGEKMKLDGGVRPRFSAPSLDTKGTPFGEYDAAIVAAIQQRWYDLLDQQAFAREHTGRVILEFRLNYDGRITDMKVIENDVSDLLSYLCQRAITEPAPYAPWPSDLRRLMGADYREVRFTFFYD
jgi:protein TonB